MERFLQRHFRKGVIALAAFVLFTFLIKVIDVKPIGPEGSKVGFAALNGFVFRFFEHVVSQGDIDIGKTDRVEIVELVVAFPAGLSAHDDIDQVGVDVGIFQAPYLVKTAEGLRAVLDNLPAIADDLVSFQDGLVVVFPASDMAVESALFAPGAAKNGLLAAYRCNNHVGFPGGVFIIAMAGYEFNVGIKRGHLCDKLVFSLFSPGSDFADFQIGQHGFHAYKVHSGHLAGAYEANDLRVLSG